MTLNDEQKMNIRMNLAMNFKGNLGELTEVYNWVVGSQSGIIPVTQFKVVEQKP